MNLGHLALFRAVAEEGSISRGAERLFISQPAVSKQVAELERAVGLPLLVRTPKGVRLTEAGELLAEHARRLFAVEAEAERALREMRGLERGRLAIGASRTIGVYLLPEILAGFYHRHPGIELSVEIDNTENIQQQLRDFALDLALTEGFVGGPDLDVTIFGHDELAAVAPPSHRFARGATVSAAEFFGEGVIAREEGSGTRAVLERALGTLDVTLQPLFCLNSTEAIKRTVASGLGLAMVSALAVQDELASGALARVPLADLAVTRPLHLLRRRDGRESPAARAFRVVLLEHAERG